jgi:hypothetical protein
MRRPGSARDHHKHQATGRARIRQAREAAGRLVGLRTAFAVLVRTLRRGGKGGEFPRRPNFLVAACAESVAGGFV